MATLAALPKLDKKGRVLMYSVEEVVKREKGKRTEEVEKVVVEHHLPWNPEDKEGRGKLLKMEKRGYTYDRPTLPVLPVPPALPEGGTVGQTEEEVMYECGECGKRHMKESPIGKKHLRYRK